MRNCECFILGAVHFRKREEYHLDDFENDWMPNGNLHRLQGWDSLKTWNINIVPLGYAGSMICCLFQENMTIGR